MWALCAGSSNAAYREKERMAVRRRFRARTEADLFVSRSSRNAPIKGASKSRSVNCDGDLPRRVCANANRSLKVSRLEAIVLELHLDAS